jgi:tetratricopeptide (TPR) repeat protein
VSQGVSLMNVGREEEAVARFDKALEVSKGYADVVRDNYREALRIVGTFLTTKSTHFVVKQDVSESAVVEPYLMPLLEQAWGDLAKKYGFEPQSPVLVESFHLHDDFSVRSVGARGFPAAGVCFGKVCTLVGPLGMGLGANSWAVAAWHEFAHVVTLQLSKGQVPRWLTEGLSVHEERSHKATWLRSDMDRELYDRYRTGRLLKMADINGAFHGPDVMFAYAQGGLIADHLAETTGFAAVPKMLKLYGEDKTTEQVFREVLGLELADFDARFAAWVGKRVASWHLVPRFDDESKKKLEERTKTDPADAQAWADLARAHFQRNNSIDAGAALEKARSLKPDLADVILLEGDMASRGGRKDVARERWEKFLAGGNDDVGARLGLAALELEAGKDSEAAIRHLEAAKRCFPSYLGSKSPYLQLAKLYEGSGKPEKAIAELEQYAAIVGNPLGIDQGAYSVREKLASWYEAKKADDALIRVSEEMIEISPFGADRGDPPDLVLHKRLAKAYARKDRKEEAAREWRVQALLIGKLPEEARI